MYLAAVYENMRGRKKNLQGILLAGIQKNMEMKYTKIIFRKLCHRWNVNDATEIQYSKMGKKRGRRRRCNRIKQNKNNHTESKK